MLLRTSTSIVIRVVNGGLHSTCQHSLHSPADITQISFVATKSLIYNDLDFDVMCLLVYRYAVALQIQVHSVLM